MWRTEIVSNFEDNRLVILLRRVMQNIQSCKLRASRSLSCFTLIAVISMGLVACNASRTSGANVGVCPEIRNTEYAPASIAATKNPLKKNSNNLAAGERLFHGAIKPVSCVTCHGSDGGGNGPLASQFAPAPRNFTCGKTMHRLSDGQLFWIIKNGSVGTSMPAFNKLDDRQIWKLIIYVRDFAPLPIQSRKINLHYDSSE